MNAQTVIRRAVRENPEIALVLEIARRAQEFEQRGLPQVPTCIPNVGANPVTSQGVVPSGHILKDEVIS